MNWNFNKGSGGETEISILKYIFNIIGLGSTILFDRKKYIISSAWYFYLLQSIRLFVPKVLWVSSLVLLFLLSCRFLFRGPFFLYDCVSHSFVLWLVGFLPGVLLRVCFVFLVYSIHNLAPKESGQDGCLLMLETFLWHILPKIWLQKGLG